MIEVAGEALAGVGVSWSAYRRKCQAFAGPVPPVGYDTLVGTTIDVTRGPASWKFDQFSNGGDLRARQLRLFDTMSGYARMILELL